jgi:hypothetical protein
MPHAQLKKIRHGETNDRPDEDKFEVHPVKLQILSVST